MNRTAGIHVVVLFIRRDEVGDLFRQLAHVTLLSFRRLLGGDIKPELQTKLRGTGADKLMSGSAALISRSSGRGDLIGVRYLERFRIELHSHFVLGTAWRSRSPIQSFAIWLFRVDTG